MAEQPPKVRAIIKHLQVLNSTSDSQVGRLTDPSYFGVGVWVFLGHEEPGGMDNFHAFACSPRWLADNFAARDPETGRRLLWWAEDESEPDSAALFAPGLVLMQRWSEDALRDAIEAICKSCEGPNWDTVALQIGRYLPWEWDYRYDEYVDAHPDQFEMPWGWKGRRDVW